MFSKKMLISFIIALVVLWPDLTLEFSTRKSYIKAEYNGLLWVGLDYWSIKRYHSSDKVIPWFSLTWGEKIQKAQ